MTDQADGPPSSGVTIDDPVTKANPKSSDGNADEGREDVCFKHFDIRNCELAAQFKTFDANDRNQHREGEQRLWKEHRDSNISQERCHGAQIA